MAPELKDYKKKVHGKSNFGKMAAIDRNKWLIERNKQMYSNPLKMLVKHTIELDNKDTRSNFNSAQRPMETERDSQLRAVSADGQRAVTEKGSASRPRSIVVKSEHISSSSDTKAYSE